MAATKTVEVPHLGGIQVGYRLSEPFEQSKPTFVLVNSMCMTVSLYNAQFDSATLTKSANLLAIEPLGHGSTSCSTEHFTYWDSAIAALQTMEKLGIPKAFALGTSQGGWIVTRMALLAPEKISGLLLLGTSMDYESSDSRTKGCWDPRPLLTPFLDNWCTPNPDFVIDDVWCGMVANIGFADHVTAEATEFWTKTLKSVYVGDAGRVKAKMALLNLLSRDGLLDRLRDIKCPVYWLQGTKDVPYGTTIPAEQIKLFTNAKETKFELLEGGGHYLNGTNPAETEKAMLEMVQKYT